MTDTALNCDVLIVGGGLAGCAMAVSLHKKGLRVIVVERDPKPRERFKGEYIQPYAVKVLQKLGFTEMLSDESMIKIREMRFQDLAKCQDKLIAEVLIKYPKGSYAAVMPNKELIEKAQKYARSVLGENFLLGASLDPVGLAGDSKFYNHPVFNLKRAGREPERLVPRWVIGCDGRQSTVRKWMNGPAAPALGKVTLGTQPEFIVGCELSGGSKKVQRYDVIRTYERGTVAIFQLKGSKQRCYWNTPAIQGKNNKMEWASALGSVFKDATPVAKSFDNRFENMAGASADTVWFGPAAKGRFLLAGDALAVTTPFGGQGMTCIMHQIMAISELLGEASDKSPSSIAKLGVDYHKKCRKWFVHVNILNFGLYYLFFARRAGLKLASRHVLNHWNRNPEMLDRVGRLFGGNDLDTPRPYELLQLWGFMPVFGRKLSQLITWNSDFLTSK